MNQLKTFSFILLLSNLCFSSIKAQTSFGESVLINNNWKFILKDDPKALQVDCKDNYWQNVDLPHDWSIKQQLSPTLASCQGYLPGGIGWYRKRFVIPEEKQGEKVFLYFEGVYNRSEVYINGHLLGKRPNGYISFMYDATPYIQYGGENIIAVRVDHSRSADSRWYTGSGIYRNVHVIYSNLVHIDQWGVYVYPQSATARQGVLNIEVNVKNESASASKLIVKNELISSDGKIVAQSSGKLDIPANAVGKYNNLNSATLL